ncbi:MAG TPA: hypothetical protein VM577_21070, partial [Anaerovoracaceae bacterium]|nr:hypothetical protein [Anaerovoracaceae bacterium]
KADKDGNVEGISSLEATPSGQPGDSGTGDQTDSEEPDQPSDGSAGEPDQPGEQPEPPDTGGTGSSGGGTGGGSTPKPFLFEVSDSNATYFGSTAAAQVNIFGTEKHIAPGMKGSYRFSVDNTRNSYRSLYTVNFTNNDTLPAGSKIPMVFRLKAGNSYVAGDADWCTVNQLYQDTVIAGNSKVVYTLEWYWPEGGNDNLYAELSKDTEYPYTLRIEVTAQPE